MEAIASYLLMLQKCINYTLCLGNISKDFQKIWQLIIWKKTGLTRSLQFFPVDFNAVVTNILDIHK